MSDALSEPPDAFHSVPSGPRLAGASAAAASDADAPTTPVPAAVHEAQRLLMAISSTDPDAFIRLSASSALGQLTDLTPPYPPACPAETPLRGQALVDEATSALIEAVRTGESPGDRARALLAIEELNLFPRPEEHEGRAEIGASMPWQEG